ncbi:Mbov_0399 family ICE element protein [Mycoplasmopsis columbinasalis]|uniref:Lipoprotein n=1 Tax=Mycoplasmopsis columbinasalis TaxID=114880 RepID=A0A449BAN0_9BACT|nr:hypothetical protein [Mycoplasmopsis columbinasalis]VEU78249.1 Uncharacterised protein [Mycoplasmopsis columbinasalis]
MKKIKFKKIIWPLIATALIPATVCTTVNSTKQNKQIMNFKSQAMYSRPYYSPIETDTLAGGIWYGSPLRKSKYEFPEQWKEKMLDLNNHEYIETKNFNNISVIAQMDNKTRKIVLYFAPYYSPVWSVYQSLTVDTWREVSNKWNGSAEFEFTITANKVTDKVKYHQLYKLCTLINKNLLFFNNDVISIKINRLVEKRNLDGTRYNWFWLSKNGAEESTNVRIKTYNIYPNKQNPNAKYEWEWNKFYQSSKLERIVIESDTGGDLYTPVSAGSALSSNQTKLEQYLDKINRELGNNLKLTYTKESGSVIDLYLRIKSTGQSSKLYNNLQIEFATSDNYNKRELGKRLIIQKNKIPANPTNSYHTGLIDDIETKIVNYEGIREGEIQNGEVFDITSKFFAPVKIIFNTTNAENEYMLVNGKKIEVYNKQFEAVLTDNRQHTADNERIWNENIVDRTQIQTIFNSHKRNEYLVELIQVDPNNKKLILKHYKKIFVIDSLNPKIDFKWYGWDPDRNSNQKALIEEFIKNDDGSLKVDQNGQNIRNPLYDPLINKETGTKKELVLINFDKFQNGQMLKNTDTKFSYETFKAAVPSLETFYKNTKLPAKTNWILPSSNTSNYVIAEAIVLNKGGLKKFPNKQKYLIFKLAKDQNDSLFFKPINTANPVKWYEEQIINNSDNNDLENDFFSSPGLWLFASKDTNKISSFKLVYIVNEQNSNKLFTEIYKESNNVISPLFSTIEGQKFYNFLRDELGHTKDDITKFSYEQILEFYKLYVYSKNLKWENKNISIITPIINKEELNNKFTKSQFQHDYVDAANGFQIFANNFLLDFPYKSYAKVQKIKLAQDTNERNFVEVNFVLDTVKQNYYLSSNVVRFPILFKPEPLIETDQPQEHTTSTENEPIFPVEDLPKPIELVLNHQYFIDQAHLLSKDKFKEKILEEKQLWFLNSDNDLFQKIDFNLTENDNNFKISAKFKDEKNMTQYYFSPTNEFIINISEFGTARTIEEKTEIDENPENEDKKQAISISVFENISIPSINLNGLDEPEKIIEYLKTSVKEFMENLVEGEDYVFKNIDEVAVSLSKPQKYNNSDVQPKVEKLIISAADGRIGLLEVEIINFVKNIFKDTIDLSNLEFEELNVEATTKEVLKNTILNKIKRELKKENIVLDDDVYISNLEQGVNKLNVGNGEVFSFEILPLNKKIINSANINIKILLWELLMRKQIKIMILIW